MPQETRVWHLSTILLRVWFACDIHYNESLLHDDICKLFRRLNLPVSLRFWWEWNFSGTQLTVLHRMVSDKTMCVCSVCVRVCVLGMVDILSWYSYINLRPIQSMRSRIRSFEVWRSDNTRHLSNSLLGIVQKLMAAFWVPLAEHFLRTVALVDRWNKCINKLYE